MSSDSNPSFLHTALSNLPERSSHKIKGFRHRDNSLQQTTRRIQETLATWLRREDEPKGFRFELPQQHYSRVFNLYVEGRRAAIQVPYGKAAKKVFKEVHTPTIEKYAPTGESSSAVPFVRAGKMTVTEEQKRQEDLLLEEYRKARKVLNAWTHILAEESRFCRSKLPTPQKSEKAPPRYDWDRDVIRLDDWRRAEEKPASKLHPWLLQRMAENYPPSELAGHECRILWETVRRGDSSGASGHLEALGSFFNVSEVVTRTTMVGLLYHVQRITEARDALLFLDAKRVTLNALLHALAFNKKPASWEVEVHGNAKYKQHEDWIVNRFHAIRKTVSTDSEALRQTQQAYAEHFDVSLENTPNEGTIRRYLGWK